MLKRIIVIIILLVVIVCVAALFVLSLLKSDEDDGKSYACYVAVKVTGDGDALTDKGVKEYFGLADLSEVMTIYLKDTGDCSVVLLGQGDMGTWKEKDDVITVDAVRKKLNFKKNFDKLIYESEYEGKKMRFVLEKADKLPEVFKQKPELTYGLKYSKKATSDLANFMLGGQYLIKDDTVYGKFFDLKKNRENTVFAMSPVTSASCKVLAADGQAKYLSADSTHLYYKWLPKEKGEESICKVPLEGGSAEVLRTGECDYVQVRFGKVYYTDEKHRFCVMSTDGKNQKVLIDRVVYLPYVIDRGWVIFQDDADGEKLHIATLNGLYDKAITDKRSYSWIIQGRSLYYTGTKDKDDAALHKCKLYKMYIGNLEMMEETKVKEGTGELGDLFALNSTIICGGDAASKPIQQWSDLKNSLYDGAYYENSLMYLSDQYMISGKLNETFTFYEITLKNLKKDSVSDLLNKKVQ